jgi:uncharacterized membrane protein HdeD (DUF308 family)
MQHPKWVYIMRRIVFAVGVSALLCGMVVVVYSIICEGHRALIVGVTAFVTGVVIVYTCWKAAEREYYRAWRRLPAWRKIAILWGLLPDK